MVNLFSIVYVVIESANNDTWRWFLYALYKSIKHSIHHKPFYYVFNKIYVMFTMYFII